MLYVFTTDGGVMVSNVDPNSPEALADWDQCEREGFVIQFPADHRTPLETEANIIRNKLINGGAKVEMR